MRTRDVSKFLSLILRHKPETIGLKLDQNGWADLNELISKINTGGKNVNLEQIKEVVKTNSKQRFKLDLENNRIRANQGHSIKIDMEFSPTQPPEQLFHGTAERNISSIKKSGIQKRNRQHVHLSSDLDTAKMVGKRHGKPVIFVIDSKKMFEDGYSFFLSENGVWLTDAVSAEYFVEVLEI